MRSLAPPRAFLRTHDDTHDAIRIGSISDNMEVVATTDSDSGMTVLAIKGELLFPSAESAAAAITKGVGRACPNRPKPFRTVPNCPKPFQTIPNHPEPSRTIPRSPEP